MPRGGGGVENVSQTQVFVMCLCVCVCVRWGGFVMCGCLVICVLVFTVFCTVCTIFMYCFVYPFLFALVLSVLF